MSKLTEGYFNDKNITSDEITQEIEQTSDNYMPYKFLVSIDNFYDDNYKKVSITAQQYKEILKRVFIFCKHSDMFDEFEIELGYSTDEGIDYIGLTEPNAIRKTLKLLFIIRFKVESVPNFKLFVMSIQKLTTLIYLLISERFKLRIAQNGFTLKEATYSLHKIKYGEMNHQNLWTFYDNIFDVNTEYVHSSSKKNLHYNGAKKLGSVYSMKKLVDVQPGDILFSTSAGILVLDPETNSSPNTPIAIATEYYNQKFKTVRFVALSYLAWMSPATGTARPCEFVFGNMGGHVETVVNPSVGGVCYGQTLQQFYDYINENNNEKSITKNHINNSSEIYHLPVFESVYEYHTLGTKQGDWYLPAFVELNECLFKHLYDINNTREMLGLEELAALDYFTCVETEEHCCQTVDMNNGILDAWFDKDRSEDTCAIAFINVKE